LDQARHVNELSPRAEVILSLDAAHSGLGNSSCGPGVLKKYAVLPEPCELRFSIHPIGAGDDPDALSRHYYPVVDRP
ncbi:MAG TPA: hypothetical protein VK995_05015, partial [Oceanipulchritudo sp.]|nr:hypothetical protein [Oceanipulchritudo sp.]